MDRRNQTPTVAPTNEVPIRAKSRALRSRAHPTIKQVLYSGKRHNANALSDVLFDRSQNAPTPTDAALAKRMNKQLIASD
jgi:hypothetical protein